MRITPKVSVILPTYNRAYILPEAVESVLKQTFPDFELIVVDDGSTDGTVDLVGSIPDPRVRLVRHGRNGGYAPALNTGLAHVRGEFVAFLDSDDLWKPEKLEAQVKFLDEHPEVGGVFSDLEWVRRTGYVASELHAYPVFSRLLGGRPLQGGVVLPQRAFYVCLLEEMSIRLVASLLRWDRVREVGTFEESWKSGQDYEFLLRFTRANALGYIDCALTVARVMADSTLVQYKKLGSQCLVDRFIREKRQLRGDRVALAAVRRGIAHYAKDLGWQYLAEGDRANAFKAYLKGFSESGDLTLLARSGAAFLPGGARVLVKRFREALLS